MSHKELSDFSFSKYNSIQGRVVIEITFNSLITIKQKRTEEIICGNLINF